MAISQRHIEVPIFDFSGGINTRARKTRLAATELEDALNCHLTAGGGLERRRGYAPYVTSDTATTFPIQGVWQHRTNTTNYVMRIQNAKVEYDNAGTWTNITGAETVATGADNRWLFSTFRDYSVFTNGTNIPLKWNGTGNVAKIARAIGGGADTIDKCGTLVLHRERTVMGDVTATETSVQTRYESVIWPSDSGTLDTWSAAPVGKIHIDQGDGDSITNLQDVMGYLVVFKQHSLHRVSNLGVTGTQDRIRVASVGTPGRHTAIVVDTLVYFLDEEGQLWAYDARGDNEDSVVNLSSPKLGMSTLDNFVGLRLQHAHLFHDATRDEIYCFLTQDGATSNNVAWVYSRITGGFTRFQWNLSWNVSTSIETTGANVILAGSSTGLVAKLDFGTDDNGTAFVYEFTESQKSGEGAFEGALGVVKGFRGLDMYTSAITGTPVSVDVSHYVDFSLSGPSYAIALLLSGGDTLG